jgi:uncharacterized protein
MTGAQPFFRRWWLPLVAALLLALPILALLVTGSLWLWQRGWFLWWLIVAAAGTGLAWGITRHLRRGPWAPKAVTEPEPLSPPNPTWTPREVKAWQEVRRLSAIADPAMLADRRLLLGAAQETIEAVARHYHPEQREPLWEFTVPEMLLLTERVSARVRVLLLAHVPMSHQVKAGQLVRVWGYKPLVAKGLAHGRRAYDLFRIVRAINPLHALVAELRERFLSELSDTVQDYVLRKVARIWIEEVGRAAIDLYSGRLRVDAGAMAATAAGEGLTGIAEPAPLPGALRLLVAGQTKAGKSTLVNALVGDVAAGVDVLPLTAKFQGYELRQDGAPAASIIDTPGIENEGGVRSIERHALECDLILWVIAAHRADRALDRKALDAVRARFAQDPRRKMPPLVVIATHVDRLPPVREWEPPYNVDTPTRRKEQSIRAAIDAIAGDLAVPVTGIVPVRLDGGHGYNLDALSARLAEHFDAAKQARWLRIQGKAQAGDWRRTLKQLSGAGRMVGEFVKR